MSFVGTTFKTDRTAIFYEKVASVAADIRESGTPSSSVDLAAAIATGIEYFDRGKKKPPPDWRAYSQDREVVRDCWLDNESKDGCLTAVDGCVFVDRTGKRTVTALQIFAAD